MKLILLGAPGAGKGTQAGVLNKELGIPTISTGNMIRAAIKEGTPVGLRAAATMKGGRLAPDDLVLEIIHERVAKADCANGYILDGAPRTLVQAEALERDGIQFDHVISLEIPDEVVMARMTNRRVCESCGASYHLVAVPPRVPGVCDACGGKLIQRKDDEPETVKERLEIYHRETEPLKKFYRDRGLLRQIENQPTLAETTQVILRVLGRESDDYT